jgi:hypothetical protein
LPLCIKTSESALRDIPHEDSTGRRTSISYAASPIRFCDDSFCCASCAYASPFWRGVSFSLRTYGETPIKDFFLWRNYGRNTNWISRKKKEQIPLVYDGSSVLMRFSEEYSNIFWSQVTRTKFSSKLFQAFKKRHSTPRRLKQGHIEFLVCQLPVFKTQIVQESAFVKNTLHYLSLFFRQMKTKFICPFRKHASMLSFGHEKFNYLPLQELFGEMPYGHPVISREVVEELH